MVVNHIHYDYILSYVNIPGSGENYIDIVHAQAARQLYISYSMPMHAVLIIIGRHTTYV